MPRTSIEFCRVASLTFSLILAATTASADQFKVEKVKGNKAVIDFSGSYLSPGKTYTFSGGGGDSQEYSAAGERGHLIGGSFEWSSLTAAAGGSSGSSSASTITLNTRFGWNLGSVEFGPAFQYNSVSNPSSSIYALGAFGDYNFTPNKSGVSSVFGVGGELDFGSQAQTDASASVLDVYVSGFFKWFPTANPFCLRGDLGYVYDKYSYSTSSLTKQGLDIRAGIAEYF